jgi:threonine aldolase
MIDLRSDTVTRPTPGMLEAMMHARVGDDVLGDDPTVQQLEEKAAAMFGREAALFCPSGTMTNQIAINVHTRPGDEVICHRHSHVYYYEGGAMMRNSGVSVCLLDGTGGLITADQVVEHINPDDVHRPVTRLVEVENTMNKGGGTCYSLKSLEEISSVCKNHGLKLHLDGARLFNALTESGDSPVKYGAIVDSISICLSKGLGAPVGSLLIGNKDFIKQARRVRKAFGGGMRQAGFLAAAGIYAFDHHITRLKDDHSHARRLGEILTKLSFVESIRPVETNIVLFRVKKKNGAPELVRYLKDHDIHALYLDPETIRFVTHLDFDGTMIPTVEEALNRYSR